MFTPGQKLDYYVGGRFKGTVHFILMSKSGKRSLVHYIDKPKWQSMWVQPDKLKARDGAA